MNIVFNIQYCIQIFVKFAIDFLSLDDDEILCENRIKVDNKS